MVFWSGGEKNGGWGRNRTGVRGVAVRCMTTLPPSPWCRFVAKEAHNIDRVLYRQAKWRNYLTKAVARRGPASKPAGCRVGRSCLWLADSIALMTISANNAFGQKQSIMPCPGSCLPGQIAPDLWHGRRWCDALGLLRSKGLVASPE